MFSLRQILLLIGILSVVSLVISLGLTGSGWALGVTFGAAYLSIVLVVMLLGFLVIEFLSKLWGAVETQDIGDYSPFRAERPEKMPDQPERPDLERMMPGWDQEGGPAAQQTSAPQTSTPQSVPQNNGDTNP